jgi:putative ABC transport system permease protein
MVIVLIGGFYEYIFSMTEKDIIASEGHILITGEKKDALIDNYSSIKPILERDPDVFMVTPSLVVDGVVGYEEKSALFHGDCIVYGDTDKIREFVYKEKSEGDQGSQDGAEIGSILARNLGVKGGDIVNILTSFEGMTTGLSLEVRKIVTTVSEKLDRVYLKMPLGRIQDNLGIDSVHSIRVVLREGADSERVKNRLLAKLRSGGWSLKAVTYDNSGSYLRSVIDIYMNNYYFILVVIIVTVFFAISNITAMSIMERTREMGTMRSFGMRKKHLFYLFLNEGFFIGLLGSIVGICISILVILIINGLGGIYIPPQPTEEKGFYSLFFISRSAIGLSLGVSVLISVLASFFSTLRINSMSIIDELGHI